MANDVLAKRNLEFGTGAPAGRGKIVGADGFAAGIAGGSGSIEGGRGGGANPGGTITVRGGGDTNSVLGGGFLTVAGATGAGMGGAARLDGGTATVAGQDGGTSTVEGGEGLGGGFGGTAELFGGIGNGAGEGGGADINGGAGGATGAGGVVNVYGGIGNGAADGGKVTVQGGAGAGNGGDVEIDSGSGGAADGTVLVGTGNAKQVDIGRTGKVTRLLGELATPQTGMALVNGTNANVDVTGTAGPSNVGKIYYRITGPTAAFSVSGFADTVDGRILIVQNPTTQNWTILNDNAGSTDVNRIITQTGADVVLAGAASAWFIYDPANTGSGGAIGRWILLGTQEGDAASSDTLQWAATGNANATGANRYLNQWAALGAVLTVTPPSLVAHILVPGPTGKVRTLRNARAEVTTAPGVGGILSFTLQKSVAGVATDTAITFTIAGAGVFTGSDLVNTVTVLPGEFLTVRHTRNAAAANPGNMNFSVELV